VVDEFHWNAFPAGTTDAEQEAKIGERSFVSVNGRYRDNTLRLRIFGTPPAEVSPGLRHFADGSWEAV
jgi:hypothetical protein